jgi:hypothetical protein
VRTVDFAHPAGTDRLQYVIGSDVTSSRRHRDAASYSRAGAGSRATTVELTSSCVCRMVAARVPLRPHLRQRTPTL